MASVKPHEEFEGVYRVVLEEGSTKLATLNLAPGVQVYGEELVSFGGNEYRTWDPYRSKLAAAILKGLRAMPIRPGRRVLYLGSATGTTASHVSDIVGPGGAVYCVEISARAMREFIERVGSKRGNVYPILDDARLPGRYRFIVPKVDVIYCDVAQPDQARILAENADLYLREGGEAIIAIKSRSIDVTEAPSEVFEHEVEYMKARGFRINQRIRLEPYHRDHELVVAGSSRAPRRPV